MGIIVERLLINKDTQLCMSLSGRPGNFGTRFHNFLYEKLRLNFVYKAFTTSDIAAAVAGIRALGIRSCAISMPYKETCMPHLDRLEASAKGIESVNTIVNDHGVLSGFNTDFIAVRDLLKLNVRSPQWRFAVRGSGGMAKAVVCALKDVGLNDGVVVARNEATGRALAERYGYQWVAELKRASEVLINASPLGMAGGPEEHVLPFSAEHIAQAKLIFDVVAIPIETPLIQNALELKIPMISGFEVITRQALEQFVLYTGVRPSDELVREAALFARG